MFPLFWSRQFAKPLAAGSQFSWAQLLFWYPPSWVCWLATALSCASAGVLLPPPNRPPTAWPMEEPTATPLLRVSDESCRSIQRRVNMIRSRHPMTWEGTLETLTLQLKPFGRANLGYDQLEKQVQLQWGVEQSYLSYGLGVAVALLDDSELSSGEAGHYVQVLRLHDGEA